MSNHLAANVGYLVTSVVPAILVIYFLYIIFSSSTVLSVSTYVKPTIIIIYLINIFYLFAIAFYIFMPFSHIFSYIGVVIGASYSLFCMEQEFEGFRWYEIGILIPLLMLYLSSMLVLNGTDTGVATSILLSIMVLYPYNRYFDKKQLIVMISVISMIGIAIILGPVPNYMDIRGGSRNIIHFLSYTPLIILPGAVVLHSIQNSQVREFSKVTSLWSVVVLSILWTPHFFRFLLTENVGGNQIVAIPEFLLPDPNPEYYLGDIYFGGALLFFAIPPLLMVFNVVINPSVIGEFLFQDSKEKFDWPQTRYDAARIGAVTPSQWSVPNSEQIQSLGSVQAQELLFNEGRLYVLSDSKDVLSITGSSGQEVWNYTADDFSNPRLLSSFKYVYVVGDRSITALVAADGSVQWSVKIDADIIGTPVIKDMTMYYPCTDGTIHARDGKTGDITWIQTEEPAAETGIAADAETLYLGLSQGQLAAYDASDGDRTWIADLEETPSDAPIVTDSTVYVPTQDGSLRIFETDDGTDKLTAETELETVEGLAVAGDIYLTGSCATVQRITEHGEQVWKEAFDMRIRGPPILIGTTLIVHTESKVYALMAASGDQEWSLSIDGTITALVASHNGIHIGTTDGLQTVKNEDSHSVDSSEREVDDTKSAVEQALSRAANAVTAAEKAHRRNEFDSAITEYETATTEYERALEELEPEDDRYDELQSHLETVTTQLESLQEQRGERTRLVEQLTAAENHFQTAIGAPASDRVIVTRERYRQARNAYDEALEILNDAGEDLMDVGITISPQPTVENPPENLSEFPGIHPSAEDILNEMDLNTLTALRDAERDTVETLRDHDAIGPQLGIQLIALSQWHDGNDVIFASKEDIERRRELTADGYQVHQ